MLPVPGPGKKSRNNESEQNQDLHRRERVLNARNPAHSEEVQNREHKDETARKQLGTTEVKLKRTLAQGDRALLLDCGEEIANIIGEGERGGCNRGRKSGEERNPAGHESPGGAVCSREIDVLASRARKVDPQLRVAESTCERDGRANEPDAEYQRGAAEIGGEKSGGRENSCPHHVRHDERNGANQT